MRIKTIFIYLFVFFVYTQTQAQIILDKPETATRTVQDPKTVILSPGFYANGTTSNPFIARIGTSTEIPPASANNSTAGANNPSGESTTLNGSLFHDTKGDIAVGSGGQLTYSLPIALPPGINSVAPQMNLTYTSGSGNGIAGYGWSLSGITNIARATKNIEKDGELKGIQLDYSDFYHFNGNRLLLKSGEYGKDGAEYVTEKYSNLKIKSIGTISGQSYQGPLSWEITFEDGSQAWYGTNPESRTPIEYNITKWKDAQGNYITYNYNQTEKVAHISTVQWGGNEALAKAHFNELIFQYAMRDSKEVAYSNGITFVQQSILTNVRVNTNGVLFKKYEITYKKDSNNTQYQYVDKITEYNSQNQAANPVVFNYEQSINSDWNNKNFSDNDNKQITGDFDGDGKLDYLKYYESYTECIEHEEYEEIVDDGNGPDVQIKTRCLSSVQRNAGINLFASFFNNTGQMRSVSPQILPFTKDEFNTSIAINYVKSNGQVSSKQGILIRKMISISGSLKKNIVFEIYGIENEILTLVSSRLVPAESYDKSEYTESGEVNTSEFLRTDISTYITNVEVADIDGNGVSEIIINYNTYVYEIYPFRERFQDEYETIENYTSTWSSSAIIVEFEPSIPLNNSITYYDNPMFISGMGDNKIGDFNGNGKQDILVISMASNEQFIKEFYKNQATQKFEYYQKGITTVFKGRKDKALLGDFNGDGKTDLFIPMAEESKDWNMYISTGNGFTEIAYPNFSYYKPNNSYVDSGRVYYYNRQYIVQDLNQDGKSDFIEFSNHSRLNQHSRNNLSRFIVNTFENKGFDSATGKYIMEKKNIDGHTESVTDYPFSNTVKQYKSYPFNYIDSGKNHSSSPAIFAQIVTPDQIEPYQIMTGDFRINNSNSQIIVMKKGKMLNFSYAKVGAKINSIVQGGITTEIEYKELDPDVNPGFYASGEKEQYPQYPYVELDRLSQSFGVAQLRQAGRKQDYKYRGFISNLQGRGMIGYRKTAISSWYASGFENSKIWSVSEIDPLNNGVPIKEWSTRDESNLFPADANENTAGLLSFKRTDYETTKLPSGVEAMVTKSTLQKDFLTQVTNTSTIEYDNYFLPKKSVLNTNNGFGTKTTELTYAPHNESGVGSNYYIGRMVAKEETVTAYGDTKKSKQEYTFANNLVQTIKSYNNDYSGYVLDSFVHDGFGNVLEKTTTNSVDGQTQNVKTIFDDKGRFVIKKIDNLGLEAQTTYNDWGQVLTQTDPLGNTATNTYDAWGKLLKSHDNLSGYVTYKYEKQDFITTVTQYSSDGNSESTVTNPKGETILTRTKAFNNNQYIEKAVTYDILGRKTAESEPYLSSESPKWNTISYDESVFPPKGTATAFNGKQVETKVEGRTTIITELNGYNRVTKKTTDALGNVIESEDKGGTIQFTYNAAGQNLTATYGQNVVTTTYDNWGRKASFHDPSNGMYSYTYHGFGQLKKETSPKGYKEYAYNNAGQLITQTEKSSDGTSTNKDITFTYDPKGRITSRQGTSNGKGYSSYITYDAQGRTIASGENSNNRYFLKKNVVYDDKGRVTSYEKGMYSGGTYTKATIENVYSNWSGDLQQVKDKTNQKVLWQLDAAKANGQVLSAKLGAVSITNTYDNNNFLTAVNHTYQAQGQTPVTVLGLGYSFDAIKNELNQRTRTGFGIATESFVYDNNNRLLNWTNPKTGQMSNNVYDEKGRITENDQLGKVNFNSPGKIYQATSIEPNANLPQHWPDAATILQKITYNENNDPIYLDGKKGDYAFEYGLNESRQLMHYGGNFDPALAAQQAKFSKYYSEDGSYEVIRDNTTGQEKHLMYIGGSPYESDIVLLKDFVETTSKFVFLHKDYLGTILAITSDTGAILEQRHFDAWGILTQGEIKLIDRGYTSHEHLQDVGIIHMNGRLYDPLMRRFLNADENIQDPYNTQNYNKYGYVMNNPLLFNDPSGEIGFLAFMALPLIKAIWIGAAVALASYTVGLAVSGNMWRWSAGGALKSMFWGAVSGAVTFGIGNLFSVAKEGVAGGMELTKLGKALGSTIDAAGKISMGTGAVFVGAACHAVAQGALSMMQGGKFFSGAAAGFLGHLGGAAWGEIGGNFASSDVGSIGFGALSGGVGAELTGGNFWQGAVTGGIVAGLNGVMHEGEDSAPSVDSSADSPSAFQLTLDGIGMTEIPFLSQGAELLSAGISFANGDTTGGLIGLGSMIPLGGKAFEAAKLANYAARFRKLHNAAEKGRAAHNALRTKVLAKAGDGWRSEKLLQGANGKWYRPDVITPSGTFIELKPNTMSGRIKGYYQARTYKKQLGIHGRVIYYNP